MNTMNHKDIYIKDIEILEKVENNLDPVILDDKNAEDLKKYLNDVIIPDLNSIEHPVAAEYVFGMSIGHPHTYVRYKLVDFVEKWIPYFSAVETIVTLTHDSDDLVSFRAIEICGKEQLEEAYPYLSPIIGGASKKFSKPNKPVGLGAQKVLTSLTDLLGTEDPEELKIIEEYFAQNGHLLNNYDFEEPLSNELIEEFCKNQEEGMILIPGGFFTYGLNLNQIPDKTFGWEDAYPAKKVWIPPYFIDKYPVTNSEYDAFTEDVKKEGHIFCHPFEPDEKEHIRNTYWDSRFEPEHPVTGIDWYDAFAFARWKGKELPSEFQWEKAARGKEETIWPWGNQFDSKNVNWSGSWLPEEPKSLEEWRKGITQFSDVFPIEPVKLAEDFEDIANSYGVVGMVGNTWEWTKSDLSTRRNFHPILHDKLDTKLNRHSFAVLKGGSFFSLPGIMYPSFRGKDIPFCRHNEMGFRCVKSIPLHKLRRDIGQPITNKAVY